MYPGVPEVSLAFSGFQILATPKSVILTYPNFNSTQVNPSSSSKSYLFHQVPSFLVLCLCG